MVRSIEILPFHFPHHRPDSETPSPSPNPETAEASLVQPPPTPPSPITHYRSAIPEQWGNGDGYIRLCVAKGTLVPAKTLRCGQPQASL